jgi:uncharacterized membrane protein YcjF (UPF0283 family)
MGVNKKISAKKQSSAALKDLIILVAITFILLILSYFFNVFIFLVRLFQDHPKAITYIDEILTLLVTLSIGLGVFSWRRLRELKKETAHRIKLQEDLIVLADAKAETERIISKQLHCEIELRKLEEKNNAATHSNSKK